MTPNDPKLTFDPEKIEGLKLIHMYELHEYVFLVKINIWPLWPQMTPGWHLTP